MKDQNQALAASTGRKPYQVPVIKREARMPIITAGSFDLFIPNGPTPL